MGQSRGYGFVQFESEESAKIAAIAKLNGKVLNDKQIFVGPFLRKEERESAADKVKFTNVYVKNLSEKELSRRYEQGTRETGNKFDGLNLYVKNLDDTVTDEKLRELFAEFGTITSCKVMRDPSGTSKGSGFVAFSAASEASRVLNEMNGKMVSGKPLYVALAQRKEERRAKLQAQFSQMRPAFIPGVGPRGMPMFPGGAPGLGQQIFYGQGPPPIIPHQPGFGYQPQMMRPNYFGPMMQPGQQGPRPGGRRSGDGPMRHQPQQPMPYMQPQMMPRGRGGYRYPPGRSIPDGSMPGMVAYDMSGTHHLQPLTTAVLASSLAQASPAQQRTLLGESLYPLVDQIEHENAAKVTGMLLEMDQTEVLHLLESPEALNSKVSEALDVLRNVNQPKEQVSEGKGSPSDLLASLSINDHL